MVSCWSAPRLKIQTAISWRSADGGSQANSHPSLPPRLTHLGKRAQPQTAPTPQLPLTLFTVLSVLVQPVPIPASAQVAPERVDTLLLAAAIVFGTLVFVCWDQWTLLRRAASLPLSLEAKNLLKSGFLQGASQITVP